MPESAVPALDPLVGPPGTGRIFRSRRKVRLGDVRPDGILRLDALTRYTQDVSNDDTTDAALPDDLAWVVRRTTVDVVAPARFGEHLDFSTFCAGLGGRWAERRLAIVGTSGARYEVASLWIHLDPATGRPRQLSDEFLTHYGTAAGGRRITARLTHPDPINDVDPRPWPLRSVDFDLFDHVNNAAYWTVLEEQPSPWGSAGPQRIEIEYRAGIGQGQEVVVAHDSRAEQHRWWWLVDGACVASARAVALPATLYHP